MTNNPTIQQLLQEIEKNFVNSPHVKYKLVMRKATWTKIKRKYDVHITTNGNNKTK